MGEVYQATDTKLNRQVALKIPPEACPADPDRLACLNAKPMCSPRGTIPTSALILGWRSRAGSTGPFGVLPWIEVDELS